jgi:hypothetical protein
MNVLINPYNFNINEVFFLEKKENTIMKGIFMKLI